MNLSVSDVGEVVRSVWDCMLGLDAETVELEALCMPTDHLLGAISISGEWTGMVIVEASDHAARTAACRMLDQKDEDLTADDILDTLAELTNIVGGNIKSLVPGPSGLALPSVTSGEDYDLRLSKASLLCRAAFNAGGQPLRISVWEKKNSEQPTR
jgi:chemotaxis protein CheX